jgi:5,10-methenyltetrahydromethanopterin hydrogenase
MKLTIRLKGGAGSGNHGHKGIPGHQGGSLPQGSSNIIKDPDKDEVESILFDHRNMDDAESAHAEDDYHQLLDNLGDKFNNIAKKLTNKGQDADFMTILRTYADINGIKFKKDERDALAYIMSTAYGIE